MTAQEADIRMLFAHNVELITKFKALIDDERIKAAIPDQINELNEMVDKMLGKSATQETDQVPA